MTRRTTKQLLLAWSMLGFGLLATGYVSLQVKLGIAEDTDRQFSFTCDQVTLKIRERLDAYALILRGGVALFDASDIVERQEWKAYTETLRAQRSIAGAQGIGFAQVIAPDQLASHIARIRAEGFPEYSVHPPGKRDIYTSIIYLEPFRDRNLRAFGYDMFSEPVRRAAMEQARDTGEAALSGKVELVQETGTEVQAGTLMYVPVYRHDMAHDTVEQRRAALFGWVYSPYRMNDLMAGILGDWQHREGQTISLQIYDGHEATPETLLFASKTATAPDWHSLLQQQRTIDFNGHQWLLKFDRIGPSSNVGYAPAWAALAGGIALSSLLFGLMLSVINTQANAARIAENLTREQKRIAEALQGYNDRLEDEVQQRTGELVLARDAAESANKAKSVFLASMSHELRTPLNAILGFSSMMCRDSQLSPGQRENLDIINRSGEHLLSLINDVLEMAKIEAGRVQLGNVAFDLGRMVRDVTDMMLMRAQEKGLQLLIDQSSKFPRYIVGDEAHLRQILINLVGNAIKFTEQGGVTLRLGTKLNKTGHLLIEVEDTGPGIAPENQQRIFEPFVQAGSQGSSKGTGLGLAITRQFVQLMGGSLSLESTPGKGSLFRVELPLEVATETDVVRTLGQEKGDVAGLVPGQPEFRILIIEDQLENRLLLTQLMENIGIQVKVAKNGKEGVALFQNWQPHLILMDRRMPVMDGLEATRAIRQLPGGKAVKIVAVTASAFMEQRDEMLNVGMDDFVRKPYRANEIYECLSKHLGVRYIYEGNPELDKPVMPLTPDMLAVLPEDLCSDLKSALESLESERIALVIEQVAPYGQQLQKLLAHLAENYDYGTILKALREK